MPSRHWRRAWRKAHWLKRLSGAISRPSRNQLRSLITYGLERADAEFGGWWPASPASRTAWQASGVAPMMSAIYGRQQLASLQRLAPNACFLKTLLVQLDIFVSESSPGWKDMIIAVRQDYLRRVKSARHTSASDSSYWPTPASRDYKGANGEAHLKNGTGRKHLVQLPNFVCHSLPPDHPTLASGGDASHKIQTLNPRFVEWLMGWPPGWTAYDLPATEWCRYRRLLHSRFWELLCATEIRKESIT